MTFDSYEINSENTGISIECITSEGQSHRKAYVSYQRDEFIADGYSDLLPVFDTLIQLPQPTPDPIQVPCSISMRQCRLYLNSITLLDDVDAAIMQMPKSAQIEWEYATEVRRDNPLVPAMQQMFAWTDAQMDEMFTIAAGL